MEKECNLEDEGEGGGEKQGGEEENAKEKGLALHEEGRGMSLNFKHQINVNLNLGSSMIDRQDPLGAGGCEDESCWVPGAHTSVLLVIDHHHSHRGKQRPTKGQIIVVSMCNHYKW